MIHIVFWTILVINFVKNGETKDLHDFINKQGNSIRYDDNSLRLMCMGNSNLNSFEPFNHTLTVKRVQIVWCVPSGNDSYTSFLRTLNVDVNIVKKLHLIHIAAEKTVHIEISKTHFTDLNIDELHVENDGYPFNVNYSVDFLNSLNTMVSLIIDNIAFPPITNGTSLKKIILRNGGSLGEFGFCKKIEELNLIYWTVPTSSKYWLAHCWNLIYLKLERMTLTSMNTVLTGLKNIQNLTLTRCDLNQIPHELLKDSVHLKHLEITYNFIQNIRYDELIWLESLTSLVTLDLSHNEILTGFYVFWLPDMRSSMYLREISIAHNPIHQTCRNETNRTHFQDYKSITLPRLSLAAIGLTNLCFAPLIIESLEFLDLVDNGISVLKYKELPVSNTRYVADLRRNPITSIEFDQMDYEKCTDLIASIYTNITINMNSNLDCDCVNGWFAKALREQRLSVEGARCEDNIDIILKPPKDLECNKTTENGCILREYWNDTKVIAICNGNKIDVLPTGKRFKEIYAADNDIEIIRVQDLPPTLKFLDLRGNTISRVDDDVARALFNHSRRLLLRGNPILCSCKNKYFIEQLQLHYLQVIDYDYLTCAGEELAIRDVDPNDLCSISLLIPMVASGTLIFFILLGYIIYRMYGQEIKMFLFTHGWCLCCVHEEDLDADRAYDAFIAFCHDDYQFVTEQLLEVLEPEYRFCLHYRDWIVGEWIPVQIQASILSSKRTVIVLSQQFLQSIWGMFEFRMAFAMAMKEGRNRIILIVLDDVIDAVMPLDLQHFVSNNTYLKRDDPWFYQKIRYALPHKLNGSKNESEIRETNLAIKQAVANVENGNMAMVDIRHSHTNHIENGHDNVHVEYPSEGVAEVVNA